MKQPAKKSENLSLVKPDARISNSSPEDKASILRESFDHWLSSVAPKLVQTNRPEAQPGMANRLKQRPLTSTEVTRVSFATVREGTEHVHWPPDVVLSFLAAEVIKRK